MNSISMSNHYKGLYSREVNIHKKKKTWFDCIIIITTNTTTNSIANPISNSSANITTNHTNDHAINAAIDTVDCDVVSDLVRDRSSSHTRRSYDAVMGDTSKRLIAIYDVDDDNDSKDDFSHSIIGRNKKCVFKGSLTPVQYESLLQFEHELKLGNSSIILQLCEHIGSETNGDTNDIGRGNGIHSCGRSDGVNASKGYVGRGTTSTIFSRSSIVLSSSSSSSSSIVSSSPILISTPYSSMVSLPISKPPPSGSSLILKPFRVPNKRTIASTATNSIITETNDESDVLDIGTNVSHASDVVNDDMIEIGSGFNYDSKQESDEVIVSNRSSTTLSSLMSSLPRTNVRRTVVPSASSSSSLSSPRDHIPKYSFLLHQEDKLMSTCLIPTTFSNANAYAIRFGLAIIEELMLIVVNQLKSKAMTYMQKTGSFQIGTKPSSSISLVSQSQRLNHLPVHHSMSSGAILGSFVIDVDISFSPSSSLSSSEVQSSSSKRGALMFSGCNKRKHWGSDDKDDDSVQEKRVSTTSAIRDASTRSRIFLSTTESNIQQVKGGDGFAKGDMWVLWRRSDVIFEVDTVCEMVLNARQSSEPTVSDANELMSCVDESFIKHLRIRLNQIRTRFIEARTKLMYPYPWYQGVLWMPITIVRSIWHGFSDRGSLEVTELDIDSLAGQPIQVYGYDSLEVAMSRTLQGNKYRSAAQSSKLPTRQTVQFQAIRCENQLTLLAMLDLLQPGATPQIKPVTTDDSTIELDFRFAELASTTLFSKLLSNDRISMPLAGVSHSISCDSREFPVLSIATISFIEALVVKVFSLNEDQQTVLHRVSDWFRPSSDGSSSKDIVLVNGVFGSGKSLLLAAICVLLKWISNSTASIRCLVCAHTNIAVDRIMCELSRVQDRLDAFSNEDTDSRVGALLSSIPKLARVGSITKIDKQLRRYLVATTDHKPSLLRDLNYIEKHEPHPDPLIQTLRKELQRVDFAQFQRDSVVSADVVGATCASASSTALVNTSFDVLILDEASQMTEPMSLLAMACARSRKMLVVGDPLQLPPTVQGSTAKIDSSSSQVDYETRGTISQTVFERARALGHSETMLRTQYRCHPSIANICSGLFYEHRLRHGVSEHQRDSLIGGLSPVVALNVTGPEKKCGESYCNTSEAEIIVALLRWVHSQFVHLPKPAATATSNSFSKVPSIGVICMYRAQCMEIRRLLSPQPDRGNFHEESPSQSHLAAFSDVIVSTVDAFQGLEMDMIIIATTRCQNTEFLSNSSRINVAISRAKHHLLLLGNLAALQTIPVWSGVLDHISSKFPNLAELQQECEYFSLTDI